MASLFQLPQAPTQNPAPQLLPRVQKLPQTTSHTLQYLRSFRDPHPVLDVIAERHARNSQPGKRTDSYKIGLCVEGGGMRGVVSGAMLMELLPYRECFDVVYGSSAGAINLTYYLTGETHGLSVYIDDISNTEFVDLRRLFSSEPVLNLDFLLEYVMHEIKPLTWESVLKSPIPLKMVASCVDRLGSYLLEQPNTKEELIACLRASAQVPMIAGDQPVTIQGRRYVDAAVFEPIPYLSAIQDGCSHILVLCTRPPPENKSSFMTAWEQIMSQTIKKLVLNSDFMDAAWEAALEFERQLGSSNESLLLRSIDQEDDLGGAQLHNLLSDVQILPVYPSKEAANFQPTCIDVKLLQKGLLDGKLTARAVLQTHPLLQ
eukprot:TRINITY_DN10256_c0_g3_i1.p1 TRINITY_DN10256_c0_g3~~TRINITY_DN10256_c0_g3_i1.p1  ORF type:complete len:374 (-),score=33.95 TRINITY_DN10256_c0_g3_i1:736-1857(-)